MKSWLPYICLVMAAVTGLAALCFVMHWAVRELPVRWRHWLRAKVARELEGEHKLRMGKAVAEAKREAELRLVESLLIPLDCLNYAVQSAKNFSEAGVRGMRGHAEGLGHVQELFFALLRAVAVDSFEATGEPFDPHFHHAVGVLETNAEPADTVAETLQHGWWVGAGPSRRMLRPAMVTVYKKANTAELPTVESTEGGPSHE